MWFSADILVSLYGLRIEKGARSICARN
jgi:hypothetical protein